VNPDDMSIGMGPVEHVDTRAGAAFSNCDAALSGSPVCFWSEADRPSRIGPTVSA